MSLVDAPSSPPPPSASSPEDMAGTTAGIDQQLTEEKNVPISTTTAVAKTVAPAPNGKTPTPLPASSRTEPTVSESMAPAADSGPTAPAAAAAEALEPAAVDSEPVPVSALEEQAVAAAAATAAAAPSTTTGAEEAVVQAGETATEQQSVGVDGVSVSDLKDALPAVAEAATGAGAPAAAEGAESAEEEEEASTNSLKDDPGTPEECNLFVGDLARNLTEEKLEKAFEQHGRVMSVSIKRDRATGKNLGYGFVKLSSHQEARTAKEAMQGVELGGRRVRVGWAQKNTSLYVSGLEEGAVTTEMLQREFARFGPLDKELTAIKPGAKFGFVKYRYRLHAETAKKELHDRPAFGGLCPSIQIEWNSVESNTQDSETAGSEKDADDRITSGGGGKDGGKGRSSHSAERSGGNFRQRAETSSNTVHVQFEGEQSRVSAVNEVMIRKCFTKWEPVVDVVIPASRFNGVSPGPRQLPRCWGFVHFPPTAEGERAAADAIKNLNGTTISELRVHCTMSRTSGTGWRHKQGGGGGSSSSGRSRRHSSGSGGDSSRAMSHGGGQGFGGRPARSSMDGPGATQGRGGGWGGNAGMHRHNMHMQMQQNRHMPPGAGGPGVQHPPFPPHMQQLPHHLQPHLPHHQHGGPLHPHPQAPHQHQQMYAAGFQAAAAAAGGPAFAAGQYPIPGAVPAAGPEGAGATAAAGGGAAAGGAGGGSDMIVPTPYGMAPYPYAMSFQGVPYAPAQQGYPMGYQQIYQGYSYANPPMPQGQQQGPAAGVQACPQQQQQSGPGAVPQTGPQQSGPPAVPQSGAAKSAVNAQRQQQHMGMQQHAIIMTGQGQQNPAAGSGGAGGGGLNVGVPSYMPQQMYQLPQQQLPGGAGGEAAVDPASGDNHGGVQ